MNEAPQTRATAASLLALALIFCSHTAAGAAPAQREHLTAEEIELVRNNQELDKRTDVFVRAAERRMLAITDPPAAAKQQAKEAEKWGLLPESTRAQLVADVARIFDEAVTNIDDAALHNAKSPLLQKSLKKLADAANRLAPQLRALRESATDRAEREALERALENLQEVLDAAGRAPESQ